MNKLIIYLLMIVALSSLVFSLDTDVYSEEKTDYSIFCKSNTACDNSTISVGNLVSTGGWTIVQGTVSYAGVFNTTPASVQIDNSDLDEFVEISIVTAGFNTSCVDIFRNGTASGAGKQVYFRGEGSVRPIESSGAISGAMRYHSGGAWISIKDENGVSVFPPFKTWFTICMYDDGTKIKFTIWNGSNYIHVDPVDTGTWSGSLFNAGSEFEMGQNDNGGIFYSDNYRIFNGAFNKSDGTSDLGVILVELETTPPAISNCICTSCTSETNKTVDSTPTINCTVTDATGVQAARIANDTLSFANMGSERNGTAGEGNTWVLTLTNSDKLTNLNVPQTLCITANDTLGNAHSTCNVTINVTLITSPTYSNFANNASTLTKINGVVNWSIDFADGIGLSGYIFSHNNSGTFVNGSFTSLTGLSDYADELVTITKGRGNYICSIFHVNNTNDLVNQTLLTDSGACFTVANTAPNTPTITSPSDGEDSVTINIKFNSTDIDSDSLTYQIYINDTLNTTVSVNISNWAGAEGYYKLEITANDGTDSSSNTSAIYFTKSAPNLKLNGLEQNRTYEYETTANISTNFAYIDILDNTGRYRNKASPFNYLLDILRINKFNDDSTSKNISSGSTGTVNIDNKTDLYNASFNITGFTSSGWCYQETANVSTDCGGLDTGVYAIDDTIGGGYTLMYDGNWDTYGTLGTQGDYFYINYSKPNISLGAIWQTKVGSLTNQTVTSGCFQQNPLQMRFYSYFVGNPKLDLHCWDGGSWDALVTGRDTNVIYEEAMWWNVTDFPKNIIINSSEEIINFPGTLIGNNLYQNLFISSGVYYERVNLSYTTAGSKIIYLNFSNQGNILNRTGYLNWTIKGFDIDTNNELDYTNDFSKTSITSGTINNGTSSPNGIWENFVDNSTLGNWEGSPIYRFFQSSYYPNLDYHLYKSSDSIFYIYSTLIDVSKLSKVTFNIFLNLPGRYLPDTYYYGGYAIRFWDGTNRVTIYTQAAGSSRSGGHTKYFNITMNKISSVDWRVNSGASSSEKTISIGSLAEPYYLEFVMWPSGWGSTQQLSLYPINYSGIWINRTTNSSFSGKEGIINSNHFGNYTTHTINVTPDDITAATLTLTAYEPDDTSISSWLSNDNGTTWESITNGTKHTFVSTGNKLRAKFQLKMINNNLTSPLVYSYNVKVISAPASSLIVNLGTENLVIYDFELNSTSTPLYFNGSDTAVNKYINKSCQDVPYCLIPFTFITGSSGLIEISNFNLTENINPIRLNTTAIQSLNSIPFKLTYTGGTVQIDDIRHDFRGSKNITVVAHDGTYANSINRTIFVKYSPFNLSFLKGVDFFQNFYSSRNQSDVEPYGQNSSHGIFQISSEAYDGNISIWARYNNSPHVCLTKQEFRGQNFSVNVFNNVSTLNITNLTVSNQPIVSDLNQTYWANIRSYSMINCSAYSFAFIPFEYFCFNSLDSKAVITSDFQDNCQIEV